MPPPPAPPGTQPKAPGVQTNTPIRKDYDPKGNSTYLPGVFYCLIRILVLRCFFFAVCAIGWFSCHSAFVMLSLFFFVAPKVRPHAPKGPTTDEYMVSPITGERIRADKFEEHMRYGECSMHLAF